MPFLLVLLICAASARQCPGLEGKTPREYLESHKAHGTEADPICVSQAFAFLAHDKTNTPILVDFLSFERSTKQDYAVIDRSDQYPAINALMKISKYAVPNLIKAVRDDNSELVRMNAAYTLRGDTSALRSRNNARAS